MISFALSVVLDFALVSFLFLFVLWRTRAKKTESAEEVSTKWPAKGSRVRSLRFYLLLLILASLFAFDLAFSSLDVAVRLLIPVFAGAILFIMEGNSRDLKALLVIIAVLLLVYPKVVVLAQYPNSKLYTDAWDHYSRILHYEETGSFGGKSYYVNLPIVYSSILFVSNITGIGVFYASTFYYMIINILTALFIFLLSQKIVQTEFKNPGTSVLPHVAVFVYSILSYPNFSIIRELPQSVGLLAVCIALYLFLRGVSSKSRGYFALSLLAFIFSLAHPFAPLFISFFFLIYKLLHILTGRKSVSQPSFPHVVLPSLLLVSYYSIMSMESAINWIVTAFSRGMAVVLNPVRWFSISIHSGEMSLDVKYSTTYGRVLYGMNWALPAAIGFSFFIAIALQSLSGRSFRSLAKPAPSVNALAIVTLVLSGLAFVFSFVEYAFSRYFGTYAMLFAVFLAAFAFDTVCRRRKRALRVAPILLLLVISFATLTDFDYLPSFQINGYGRDRIYVSPWTTLPELQAAEFAANESYKSGTTIMYVDNMYVHTVRFFASLNSSTRVVTFGYPTAQLDLQSLPQLKLQCYMITRNPSLTDLSYGNAIFYSNGEVLAQFHNVTAALP